MTTEDAAVRHGLTMGELTSPSTISASDARVAWVGRRAVSGGSVYFDWEGVSATISLTNVTWLTVAIDDYCGGSAVGGGSRWSVAMTTSDSGVTAAGHVISVFYTAPQVGPRDLQSVNRPQCSLPRPRASLFVVLAVDVCTRAHV